MSGQNRDNFVLEHAICLSVWLSVCRRIPTSFPQSPSHPLWGLLFKKAIHFTMTTFNIRSDPTATWEYAKQIRASSPSCQLLIFISLRKAVLDAFYLLQFIVSKVISNVADLSRSEYDANLNIRIEYYYTSWAEVSNKAINGIWTMLCMWWYWCPLSLKHST